MYITFIYTFYCLTKTGHFIGVYLVFNMSVKNWFAECSLSLRKRSVKDILVYLS